TLTAEPVPPEASRPTRGVTQSREAMRGPKHSAIQHRYYRTVNLVVLLGALLVALPLRARTVVDFDPNLDYSKYKTYAYLGGIENLVSMLVNPDLVEIRLHHSISRELDKRGL